MVRISFAGLGKRCKDLLGSVIPDIHYDRRRFMSIITYRLIIGSWVFSFSRYA